MPGCELYATLDNQVPFPLSLPVTAIPIGIPSTTTLTGFTFFTQAATFTPGVNAFGFVSSNGVRVTVGI